MAKLDIKPADACRWDILSLGEVMIRLDPGSSRVARTRQFQVWEGGGEYNVARGLRRCFGMRAALVTAIADNPVGDSEGQVLGCWTHIPIAVYRSLCICRHSGVLLACCSR